MLMRLFTAVLSAVLLLAPLVAQAARVSPMIVTVTPAGRGATARIELTNPGQSQFPVEAQIFRGVISETGQLQLIPADEDFLVFPAQVVVAPRSQQVFRVQYLGNPELAASEVYYLQIRQVPVSLGPGQSGVQIVVNFNVLVNVVPEGARPEPVVEAARPAVREQRPPPAPGQPETPATPPQQVQGVEVRLGNRGNRFYTAGTIPWEISGRTRDGAEFRARLTPEEVARHTGVGVVAPGRARLFFIPTPQPLAEGSVQVRLAP